MVGFERWVWSDFGLGGSAFWWVYYLWCASSTRLALGLVAWFFSVGPVPVVGVGVWAPRCFSRFRSCVFGLGMVQLAVLRLVLAWDPQLPGCGWEVYGISLLGHSLHGGGFVCWLFGIGKARSH